MRKKKQTKSEHAFDRYMESRVEMDRSELMPAAAAREGAAEATGGPADPMVGRILEDRYEVVRRIGSDQMAAIYEVRHLRLGKRFAMRLIHPELAVDPQFISSFEKGAHATSRLNYAHCISVTDFGQTAHGELFLVTEYLEGEPLAQLFDQVLPVGTALEIERQILLGLLHAHREGVVHGNLCPDNILLTRAPARSWRVKLINFVIHHVTQESTGSEAEETSALLRRAYQAPEQRRGDAIDERADLYAAGVILWQMLTGRLPPMIEAQSGAEPSIRAPLPPELESVAPGAFSAELQLLVRRSLEPVPANRFSSAKEMLAALDRILKQVGRGMAATAGGGTLRSWIPSPSRRWVLFISLVSVLLVVALYAFVRSKSTPEAGQGDHARTAAVIVGPVPMPPSPGKESGGAGRTLAGQAPSPEHRGGGTPQVGSSSSPVPQEGLDAGRASSRGLPQPTQLPAVLVEAGALLKQGACARASKLVQPFLAQEPSSGPAWLLLGRARYCEKKYPAALTAYTKALQHDSTLQADLELRTHLKQLVDLPAVSAKALTFLATQMGEFGLTMLVDAASYHHRWSVRQKSRALVRQKDAGKRVDWLASYILDLQQAKGCKAKKGAVANLRTLKNPRAISVLRKMRSRRVWVERIGYAGWEEQGTCIRRQVDEAIAFLRAVSSKRR